MYCILLKIRTDTVRPLYSNSGLRSELVSFQRAGFLSEPASQHSYLPVLTHLCFKSRRTRCVLCTAIRVGGI